MVTIHTIIEHFKKFPFKGNEGLLIIGTDEKAVSSYCHYDSKLDLLDTLVRLLRNNPDLLSVFADAVKFASVSCKDKKKDNLPPRLQKFLNKIVDDLDKLDEKNG